MKGPEPAYCDMQAFVVAKNEVVLPHNVGALFA